MAMATVSMLRDYLDQVPSGAGMDTKLTKILARAESIVVDALGFAFFDADADWSDVSTSAKRVQSEESTYLALPPYLAGSITSLVPMSGAIATTSEVTDYEETADRCYLYRAAGWGARRYQITAKYGYGAAPPAIVEVVLELAVNIWRSKDQGLFREMIGVDSVGQKVGGGTIKYIGGLNQLQRQIIADVRRQYTEPIT
jgi:hypothetical protein